MAGRARGPGFWQQPAMAGQVAVIDPDPDTCDYCTEGEPAIGYVQVNWHDTGEWFWRFGVGRKCVDKKVTQARPGIDLIFYDAPSPQAGEGRGEGASPAAEVEEKTGQFMLFMDTWR